MVLGAKEAMKHPPGCPLNEGELADMIRIETAWKSDMDLKVDKLVAFSNKYEALLDMLIEREQARKKIRRAVIEKTLSGLIWFAIVGLFTLAWNGLHEQLIHAVQVTKDANK